MFIGAILLAQTNVLCCALAAEQLANVDTWPTVGCHWRNHAVELRPVRTFLDMKLGQQTR